MVVKKRMCQKPHFIILLTFVVNETALSNISFSASFSSNKNCNLLSIAKASPEFTAGFESIFIPSSTSSSKSKLLSSDSKFGLITDRIHSAPVIHNSCFQSADNVFTTGSQVSTQASNSRKFSTVASEQSSCKAYQIDGQSFHQPQHYVTTIPHFSKQFLIVFPLTSGHDIYIYSLIICDAD